MKTLITVFAFTVLLSVASLGQTAPDTMKMQRQQHQQKGFVDQNGDGINDRRQQRQGKMKRRTDRFIDADGDGIRDGRECGLGLRRGPAAGKGSGKQNGKQAKGGKQ
jgi:Ni/Co efflux regulator RcnB